MQRDFFYTSIYHILVLFKIHIYISEEWKSCVAHQHIKAVMTNTNSFDSIEITTNYTQHLNTLEQPYEILTRCSSHPSLSLLCIKSKGWIRLMEVMHSPSLFTSSHHYSSIQLRRFNALATLSSARCFDNKAPVQRG